MNYTRETQKYIMVKKKKNKRKRGNQQISSKHQDLSSKKHRVLVTDHKDQSLQSLLKKHRGVAANTPPPPIWKGDINNGSRHCNFLTPQDNSFDDCLKTSYQGFHYDLPSSLSTNLHKDFDSSFDALDNGGLFLYDVVQPGKKTLTRTSVTRCLIGDAGSTYKYLGLRLFSHPWADIEELIKFGYTNKIASALVSMGMTNATLIKRSKSMLQAHISPKVGAGPIGSADFNLTLVNKMEPTSTKRDLKKEVGYGLGSISVSWHRDSGLQDFSSIAVYQSLKETPNNNDDDNNNNGSQWGVALRVMDGGSGAVLTSVPPLLIPLPKGSLYYMLDDFNHNHEHAVVAGNSGIRYSSTHRVAREGKGTWRYIHDKTQSHLSKAQGRGFVKNSTDVSLRKKREKLISHVRAQQNLMAEIEFDWLRQWYIQGQKHASLHPYWHKPIQFLCSSFCHLEASLINLLKILSEADSVRDTHITEDVFDVLIEALTERSRLRALWKERYNDPIFSHIPEDERPFLCPCLDRKETVEGQLSEDLDSLVKQLRGWRASFVALAAGLSEETKDRKQRKKSGTLTKKEFKRKASNWERLRANIK